MAKYKIIPSSMTIVQSPISIGHKAEKGVEAIEFDLTAWVEAYGSGTLTVIMRRWGDAIPYPIALKIDENNKATWTLSDTDTAKAGMAYAQLSYIVGDEVVKKSDIYTFRVMDSLVGEGEPPEAYESWLEHLTHLAAEAMAEALDIEGIVTDKTLTVDGGIADGKATGDALALKADKSTTYTKTEVDTLIESVDVETDTTLSVTGKPADAKKTGDEITALKADLDAYGEVIVDNFGTSVVKASDFTVKTNNISYSYNSAEQSLTLTKTATNQANYQSVSTPADFLVGKLTEGKNYRMHYRADVLSGSPEIRMSIRNANNNTIKTFTIADGEDGYLDFEATSEMNNVCVFITYNTAVGACQIKYSDIYLCEVSKSAIDETARAGIADVRSSLDTVNSVMAPKLGASVISASEFNQKTQSVSYAYSASDESITISKTVEDTRAWQCVSMSLGNKLTAGKLYRMSCRADVLSGSPALRMSVRKSNNTTFSGFNLEDGVPAYIDFEANSEAVSVALFITNADEIGSCSAKFTNISIKEHTGITAVDGLARDEIENLSTSQSKSNDDLLEYKLLMLDVVRRLATDGVVKAHDTLFDAVFQLDDTATKIPLPSVSISGGSKQGACTDGEYIYVACHIDDDNNPITVIKYKISDGTYISETYESIADLGHANDMAYDPDTGYIYVATMLADGAVVILNSIDLSYVDTIYLLTANEEPYKVAGICFNRLTRKLMSARKYGNGTGYEFISYEPDGTYVSSLQTDLDLSATAQGCETDGRYIYRIYYAPSCINVLDAETGLTVKTLSLSGAEPETLMYDWHGNYYLCVNSNSSFLYKVNIMVS